MTTVQPLRTSLISIATTSLLAATTISAQTTRLPAPDSADYCVVVQYITANTEVQPTNEVFDNMPDYRASKPSPNPLMIYQVVTYDDVGPIVVSCKVKTADHLRSEYGEDAAGKQVYCPAVTELTKAQAIAELKKEDPAAAAVAEAFVIDQTEPYLMGNQYLSDFQPSYTSDDGAIHFASPGLETSWESWIGYIMPDWLMGQTYCHLPTVEYMKRIASGQVEPGATITTAEDAPTIPPGN
jgi:hypothetical protein